MSTQRPRADHTAPAARDWRDHAACRDVDQPDVFFPLAGQSLRPALAYCDSCPVRTECLEDAMAGGHGGVRGGMAEDARAQLRRRRKVAGAP